MMRSALLVLPLSVAAAVHVAAAHSASYPDRPIRLIAAFPAGGNADVISRVVAQRMTEIMGKQVVVDNRGGAGGLIGTELAAHAVPDGYTLVLIALSHAVNAVIQKKLPFDPVKDFTPISLVSSVPNVLIVHQSVPAQSVPELITMAKARPGGLNYVSSTGTSLHVAGELFKSMAGVDITRVTYKSGGSAQTDLEAGRVQMSFSAMTTAMGMLKGGRVRALAITSAKRSKLLPDVPAVAEFVPGFEVTGWQGILGPANLPPAIVSRLSEEIRKAVTSAEVEKRLQAAGAEPVWNTPPAFTKFISSEIAKMSRILSKTDMMNEN